MKCTLVVGMRHWIVCACVALTLGQPAVTADDYEPTLRETRIRSGARGTIVSVQGRRASPAPASAVASAGGAYPHPRPRLAGFSPLMAIITTDAGNPLGHDLEYEHAVEYAYVGSALNPSADTGFVIGVLDSGSDLDLAAGSFADELGLFGFNLTPNSIPIGGVGGQVSAAITMPVGYFAAGLSAIDETGALDYSALIGHSNVCGLAAPAIECGNGEVLAAVVGMTQMAFHTSVIRVDTPRDATVDGVTYRSPDVELVGPFDPIPDFSHVISLEFGSAFSPTATTANYYTDFVDLETPIMPTLLSLAPGLIPSGGSFFTEILVREGASHPDNPARPIRVLFDTGAQSSIISPGVASDLSLPFDPDFTVNVCGVGGLVENVPGYWIDFVKINAGGGALEFSKAPFVVLSLTSPEGGALDGILGMNFFWNRNISVEPISDLSGIVEANVYVSDPIPVAYADNDVDFDVDHSDAAAVLSCVTGPGPAVVNPECDHFDVEADSDIDLADLGRLQRCFSGAGVTADAACAP